MQRFEWYGRSGTVSFNPGRHVAGEDVEAVLAVCVEGAAHRAALCVPEQLTSELFSSSTGEAPFFAYLPAMQEKRLV